MFIKTLKVIFAILFIPVVVSSTKAFFLCLEKVPLLNFNSFLLIGGFFAYPAFRILFFKPAYLYALGHETVHVLVTWLSGGKVTSFYISHEGGEVMTTKTNPFIRLSPYFVPIHAIFLFLIFWIMSGFFNVTRFFNEFIFLAGFTISFHIFMTIETMKTRQPDIARTGYLFSILLIYAANIAILLLVLSLFSKSISFGYFLKKTFIFSKDMYFGIFGRLLG